MRYSTRSGLKGAYRQNPKPRKPMLGLYRIWENETKGFRVPPSMHQGFKSNKPEETLRRTLCLNAPHPRGQLPEALGPESPNPQTLNITNHARAKTAEGLNIASPRLPKAKP